MEINIIPKFLDEGVTPVAKECGERLSDIVSLAFTPIIKAKAVRDKKLELFLEELDNETKKIPEHNLIEPPLNVVGPALEDVGKYYHDQEYLRKRFAKLIASSMNKECYVHPSFINIIEQLTSDEAKILNILPKKGRHEPIIDICVEKENADGIFTIYRNCGILGFEAGCDSPEKISFYIDNLKRLELVEVPQDSYLIDEWRYEKIINTDYYNSLIKNAEKEGTPIYKKRMVGLTDYGKCLKEICLE